MVWSRLGLLATGDGGTSWSEAAQVPASAAALAFASPQVGVALLTEASNPVSGRAATLLERTTDGGLSWQPASVLGGSLRPSFPAPFEMAMAGRTALLLSGDGGGTLLYLSEDAGLSWSAARLPAPPSPNLVATHWRVQSAGDALALSTEWVRPTKDVGAPRSPVGSGLFLLAADGGWRSKALPRDPLVDQLQVLDASTLVGLDRARGVALISRDGGGHWSPMTLPTR